MLARYQSYSYHFRRLFSRIRYCGLLDLRTSSGIMNYLVQGMIPWVGAEVANVSYHNTSKKGGT